MHLQGPPSSYATSTSTAMHCSAIVQLHKLADWRRYCHLHTPFINSTAGLPQPAFTVDYTLPDDDFGHRSWHYYGFVAGRRSYFANSASSDWAHDLDS